MGQSAPVGNYIRRSTVLRTVNSENLSHPLQEDGKFGNPWKTWNKIKFTSVLKFILFEKDNSKIPSSSDELDRVLPVVKPAFEALKRAKDDNSNSNPSRMAVTWIGHASVLVQMDGVTFITDPIFSERASPVSFLGPKRYRPVPCTIHDLPSDLDAVVISHSHYDHLDVDTVKGLNQRFGSKLKWFVPLGLTSWFQSFGIENVSQMSWWEEDTLDDQKGSVTFAFTPNQHWSKRTATDDFHTLWGGWAVIGPKHRFYFAGDSGYCPAFKEVGEVYGPFDAAAIPIGAYEPRNFMKGQHVNPDDAVQVHVDVRSKFTLGIHWGTFKLANEVCFDYDSFF